MLPPGASTDSCLGCVTIITYLAKGGYDFGSIGLCVCLFVSNITQTDRIAMKFYGQSEVTQLKFSDDLGILK